MIPPAGLLILLTVLLGIYFYLLLFEFFQFITFLVTLPIYLDNIFFPFNYIFLV